MSVIDDLHRNLNQLWGEYSSFVTILRENLVELLKQHNIRVHSIIGRVKDRESLRAKLRRNQARFQTLDDVSDIAGIRIITYFEEDVTKIAELIRTEFDVVFDEDKKLKLDPDRFGYISVHLDVQLRRKRANLLGPDDPKFLKAEIQIRSLLQHAWAEIEHDLGYKKLGGIPYKHRREFSRLAGLLEIVDSEFNKLRRDLDQYEDNVSQSVNFNLDEAEVDKVTLSEFVRTNTVVGTLDVELAQLVHAQLILDERYLADRAVQLISIGITTISMLDRKLHEHRERVMFLAQNRLRNEKVTELCRGISLFYLEYVLVGEPKSEEKLFEFADRFGIGPKHQRNEFTRELFQLLLKAFDISRSEP